MMLALLKKAREDLFKTNSLAFYITNEIDQKSLV